MPVQGSWVEHWLQRYCPPGHHKMVPWWPGVFICQVCHKEELAGGDTCLICGIPGERTFVLRSLEAPSECCRGKLCGPCQDEFEERHAIDGWELEAAG